MKWQRLAATFAAVLIPLHSNADGLLGNLPQANDINDSNPSIGTRRAVVFTTPAQGYTIDSVTLRLSDYQSTIDTIALGFYEDFIGTLPGDLVGGLLTSPPSASDAIANFTFLPDGALTLAGSTSYWMVLDLISGVDIVWRGSSPSITPTGDASFVGYKFSNNDGGSYVNSSSTLNSFQINATPVPEPSEYAAIAGLGLLAFARWRQSHKLRDHRLISHQPEFRRRCV